MKEKILKTLSILMIFLAVSCTSGQNSPTDSHPGSGSIKEDSDPKDSKATDTTKKDSANKVYKE